MESKPNVVARLTATRADKKRLIVEVYQDATFHKFYHFFTQVGDDAGTKTEVRVASRNEGIRPHYRAPWAVPGLYKVGERLSKGIGEYKTVKILILDPGEYERLIQAAPDALGLTKTTLNLPRERHWHRVAGLIPVRIPAGFTPLKKRFSILTGKAG